MAVRAVSMALAGTDFAHYRSFSLAAERHRRLLQDVVSADLVENADPRGTGHFDYRAGSDLWRRVPPFTYDIPAVSWAVGNSRRSLTVLAITLFLAVTAAHVAVDRRRMA
jgi:ABC-2 type transport system permease protein